MIKAIKGLSFSVQENIEYIPCLSTLAVVAVVLSPQRVDATSPFCSIARSSAGRLALVAIPIIGNLAIYLCDWVTWQLAAKGSVDAAFSLFLRDLSFKRSQDLLGKNRGFGQLCRKILQYRPSAPRMAFPENILKEAKGSLSCQDAIAYLKGLPQLFSVPEGQYVTLHHAQGFPIDFWRDRDFVWQALLVFGPDVLNRQFVVSEATNEPFTLDALWKTTPEIISSEGIKVCLHILDQLTNDANAGMRSSIHGWIKIKFPVLTRACDCAHNQRLFIRGLDYILWSQQASVLNADSLRWQLTDDFFLQAFDLFPVLKTKKDWLERVWHIPGFERFFDSNAPQLLFQDPALRCRALSCQDAIEYLKGLPQLFSVPEGQYVTLDHAQGFPINFWRDRDFVWQALLVFGPDVLNQQFVVSEATNETFTLDALWKDLTTGSISSEGIKVCLHILSQLIEDANAGMRLSIHGWIKIKFPVLQRACDCNRDSFIVGLQHIHGSSKKPFPQNLSQTEKNDVGFLLQAFDLFPVLKTNQKWLEWVWFDHRFNFLFTSEALQILFQNEDIFKRVIGEGDGSLDRFKERVFQDPDLRDRALNHRTLWNVQSWILYLKNAEKKLRVPDTKIYYLDPGVLIDMSDDVLGSSPFFVEAVVTCGSQAVNQFSKEVRTDPQFMVPLADQLRKNLKDKALKPFAEVTIERLCKEYPFFAGIYHQPEIFEKIKTSEDFLGWFQNLMATLDGNIVSNPWFIGAAFPLQYACENSDLIEETNHRFGWTLSSPDADTGIKKLYDSLRGNTSFLENVEKIKKYYKEKEIGFERHFDCKELLADTKWRDLWQVI